MFISERNTKYHITTGAITKGYEYPHPHFLPRNYSLLTFSKTSPVSTCLQYKSFENTVGKGEIARNEQFLIYPQCFLPLLRTFCHCHYIQNCRLQSLSVWKGLNLLFGKGLKSDLCKFDQKAKTW